MKMSWLSSVVVLVSTTAFAQTTPGSPAPPTPSDAPRTMAVTGCVAGGSKSDPVTLTHAMVLPFGSAALTPDPPAASDLSTPALPEPTRVSGIATQPQPAPAPMSTAAGTRETIGTSGTIAGTAPAGSSASSVDGYRLSGVDMTSWIGRRVQITGTVTPAKPLTPAVAVESSERIALDSMPEFRVLSVQPVTGPCSK